MSKSIVMPKATLGKEKTNL